MTVKLARLKSEPEPAHADARPGRRREPRFAALAEVRIESSHGDAALVMLAEVSLHGCRVRTDEAWLRAGSFIEIAMEARTGLPAIVRWVREGYAGMEFLRPIPPERIEWHDLMDMAG